MERKGTRRVVFSHNAANTFVSSSTPTFLSLPSSGYPSPLPRIRALAAVRPKVVNFSLIDDFSGSPEARSPVDGLGNSCSFADIREKVVYIHRKKTKTSTIKTELLQTRLELSICPSPGLSRAVHSYSKTAKMHHYLHGKPALRNPGMQLRRALLPRQHWHYSTFDGEHPQVCPALYPHRR